MTAMGRSAKESIQLALMDLMRTEPFEDITVKEIAHRAHVSRATFYRSFSTKEEALARLVISKLKGMTGIRGKELPDDEVRLYLVETLTHIAQNAEFFALLRKNGLTHLLYELYLREGSAYIKRFQPSAVPYQDTYYTGGTLLVIMSWIDQGMPETPEELAGIIDTLYYRRNF